MQKKILLAFIVLCFFTTTVNAQIRKGTVFLGGQAGFYTQTTSSASSSDLKESGVSIIPAIGRFIKDNLVLGVDATYEYHKSDSNYLAKSDNYGLGVFIRQYKELGKGFYLFGQARAGGSYYKRDVRDFGNNLSFSRTKGFNVQLAVYPGIAYALTKKFQLETGFSNLVYAEFDHASNKPSNNTVPESKTNNFSLGTSLSNFSGLTIGFRVLLN